MEKNEIIQDVLDEISPALPFDEFKRLTLEVKDGNLHFEQQYPGRIFTTQKHQSWLHDSFHELLNQIKPGYHLQQIFLSYETALSEFMIHKSHPNIGNVVIISLENCNFVKLRVLDETDIVDNYFYNQTVYERRLKYTDIQLKSNHAYVIKCSAGRHWGFSSGIPEGHAFKAVWAYLSN